MLIATDQLCFDLSAYARGRHSPRAQVTSTAAEFAAAYPQFIGSPESDAAVLRKQAHFFWENHVSNISCSSKLADVVAGRLKLDPASIKAWAILYGWTMPVTQEATHSGRYQMGSDEEDLDDIAHDVLDQLYKLLKDRGYYKDIGNYFSVSDDVPVTRYRPSDIQRLLNRYPVSLETAAAIYGCKPDYFKRYVEIKKIKVPVHSKLNRPLSHLVLRDPFISRLIVESRQYLYRQRGIPIRRMARSIGISFEDLWAMGNKYGAWVAPDEKTFLSVVSAITIKENAVK